jgi:hypothetical protein
MKRKIADLGGEQRSTAEPTMDEILASIRRIIANDEPAQETAATEAAGSQPLRAATPPMMPTPAAPDGPHGRDGDGRVGNAR